MKFELASASGVRMVTRKMIDEFVAQKALAVVGASRQRRKFGNVILRELQKKGFRVFAVNPNAGEIEGAACFPDLGSLPEAVDGAVVVVQPQQAVAVVESAARAGIKRLWLQQGTESAEAIALAGRKGIAAVHGHCLLMFVEPVAFYHRLHRWVWRLFGKLPA